MISDIFPSISSGESEPLLRDLLEADWESTSGPIRFRADLTHADLAAVPFFVNTRHFLTAVAAAGGTATTPGGNLNRLFVTQMFDRLLLPASSRESIRHVCKVVNEHDLWPLHLVRVMSECTGLVARRNKRFHLTKIARELLPDSQAGILYRKLFIAYFRRFDLRYDFHLRDVPGIQTTMAVILWRLATVAREWTPVGGLARQILLLPVLEQLHSTMTYELDTEEWILAGYVLNPLLDFGLIEKRSGGDWPGVTEEDSIQISPLWEKFIEFEWRAA